MLHKVLIFGDRNWSDEDPINELLDELEAKYRKRHLIIINGGAPGADIMADYLARDRGIHTARVDALWDYYHRSAGPIRNGIMAALAPDEAYGFHPNITKSKGSKNMHKQLLEAGIPSRIREG